MKTAFTNRMTAHVWAQQNQDRGQNGQRTIFFEGATIYSYGTHFPMARFVTRKDGAKCVLYNNASYSNSTGKQQSYVRQALPGDASVFHVLHVTDDRHTDNMANYQERVTDLGMKAARATKRVEYYIEACTALVQQANDYAAWFKLRQRLKVPTFDAAFIAQVKAKAAADRTRDQRRKEERERAEGHLRATAISEWRAGTSASLHYHYAKDTPCMLRVVGDTVQTSRGAEVPVDHARRLWPVIQRVRQSGVPYQRNGHTEHVGQFAVDGIGANGDMTAGCHTIKYEELARLAVILEIPGALEASQNAVAGAIVDKIIAERT